MGAVDANPDDAGGLAGREADAFDEDPGAFRASRHQIVRPLEADAGRAEILCGARQRDARDEAKLGGLPRRTGIDHESAGVKIALRRGPGPAAAASPGGLLAGDDPEAPGVASEGAAARLFVRRIDRAHSNDAPASKRCVLAGDGAQ